MLNSEQTISSNVTLSNKKTMQIHKPTVVVPAMSVKRNNNQTNSKNRQRQKKQKSLLVNATQAFYPLVKEALVSSGFSLTDSYTKNLLFWVNHTGSAEFINTLEPYQFYNHFPGTWTLARKVELARSIDMLQKLLPDAYTFHPKSFILPGQFSELKSYMNSVEEGEDRTFIVKPDKGSLGKGILLVQDPKVLSDYQEVSIAQKYISPFLIDGLKFDLRIYVLVTSYDPLRIYVHNNGMARFCTKPYMKPDVKNLKSVYSHLTNYAVNKKNEDFHITSEEDTDSEKKIPCHKRTMNNILEEIKSQGHDIEKLQYEIDEILRLTIASVQPFVARQYKSFCGSSTNKSRCFELYGFDIMLDENLKPWLLEVNDKPSMAAETEFDRNLKLDILKDLLHVIDLQSDIKKELVKQQKAKTQLRVTGASNLEIVSVFSEERESNLAAETGWRQLYPLNGTVSSIDEALIAAEKCPVGDAIATNTSKVRREANTKKIRSSFSESSPPLHKAVRNKESFDRLTQKKEFNPVPKAYRTALLPPLRDLEPSCEVHSSGNSTQRAQHNRCFFKTSVCMLTQDKDSIVKQFDSPPTKDVSREGERKEAILVRENDEPIAQLPSKLRNCLSAIPI